VAAGITHFGYLPSFLADLPREQVTHSSAHRDLSKFRGRSVAVIGAGASAVDIAAILHEQGADVHLVARRNKISFHNPPKEPRPLLARITAPRSGLGLGWKSRLASDAPLLFHKLPKDLRFRVVKRHLGPAPGWFVREKVEGRIPLHLGTTIQGASVENGKVHLRFTESDGTSAELVADHLISATGFRVAMSRLNFIDQDLRKQIRSIEDTPALSANFESSVKGLYLVGVASANSFGPLTRFAYGAKFTAEHITKHLVKVTKTAPQEVRNELTATAQQEAVRP
jgi:thioredoxin reductase